MKPSDYESKDFPPVIKSESSSNRPTGPVHCSRNGADDFFRQVNVEFLVHELKDPASIIEAGAHMLIDKQSSETPLSQAQIRTLERILRNARRTRDMLSELLEVGRAQNVCFHCHAFDPLRAVKRVIFEAIEANDPELFDKMKQTPGEDEQFSFLVGRGIRLDVAASAENLTIEQDEIKFCQIVSNLIKNGLSYRRRFVLIHLTVQHDNLCLSVRDDGPGIADHHQEAIFQRYKQLAPCTGLARGGHGLGLAVARILARSLGGDIVVESELGLGALFRFNLPVVFPS
jgi:two-component system, OmpR family, sensor kinase